MRAEESNKALTDAADKLAEEASNDGSAPDKAQDERAEVEKKVTGGE